MVRTPDPTPMLGRRRLRYVDVADDIANIKQRFAYGQSIATIRSELGMSRRKFALRMKWMHKMCDDAPEVWIKYSATAEATMRVLSTIRIAMTAQLDKDIKDKKPVDKVLLKQILETQTAIQKARKEWVEVGQSLGHYDKVAEKVEVHEPLTLGDILGPYHIEEPEDVTDVEAETG